MSYKFAVIPGDGTGPEVVDAACSVLATVGQQYALNYTLTPLPWGGQYYLDTGFLPDDAALNSLKHYDSIILGAIGDARVKSGILERGILLKLRFGLDQYINLRPVTRYPGVQTALKSDKPFSYTVIRENTGGLYTGVGRRVNPDTPDEIAEQTMVYSYKQVYRCVKYAFDYAKKHHETEPWPGLSDAERHAGYTAKLTLCGKNNVLIYMFDLWERVIAELAPAYPMVLVDYVHVDAACIYMIESPERFNIILTLNMFGDIITDLAAVTQGGMGIAAGGNINPDGVSMFEPIGGTAPAFTGKNQINPLAAIGSIALLLAHHHEYAAAASITRAIARVIPQLDSLQAGHLGMGTTDVANRVCDALS